MLINHIVSKLIKYLQNEPTPSQERLIEELSGFISDSESADTLIVKGFAGTGKTSLLSAFVKLLDEFGIKSVLLAPTGRAAKVFSSYAKRNAYTIHKKIYRQKSSKDGFGKFSLDANLHSRTIFIVDEASMISNQMQENSVFGTGQLLNDLFEYVRNDRHCKLILVGDTAQLPPVGLSHSPALDLKELSLYLDDRKEVILTDIVRQVGKSGILENATSLRKLIEEFNSETRILTTKGFTDFVSVSGTDLLEEINTCYDKFGIEETIVISRSNKRANQYNQGIRNSILFREEELVPGDLLMVVKNNYFWLKDVAGLDFIANGDIIEVLRVRKTIELYGFRFAECLVRLVDYNIEIETKLLLDSIYSESASLNSEENKKLFYTVLEDYQDLKPKKKQYQSVRENEYFNALQVKYAYAVTCHKAQGGQWKSVFVDLGYVKEEMVDKEYLRWLYTAITRATEKVYLVNFPKFLMLDEEKEYSG